VLAESLGHTLVPPTPALVPLILEGDYHTSLAGVSHDVVLTVRAAGQKAVPVRGSLLWTHFGISGPAALDASRHWLRARSERRDVTLTANFTPDLNGAACDAWLRAQAEAHPRAQLENVLAGMVPGRVAAALLAQLRVAPAIPLAHLPKDVRRQVVQTLTAWHVSVRDSRGYGKAEVTAGGVPLSEVDSATLASRRCDGLHFTGEILDVDGRLGGFNFQWSWASAMVVARALVERAAPQPT
jgi:predicted Rossmann fold flavoprotein